ncbi:MAG: acyloxyacyl hydrolase [Sphingomonadaceae bacterium]
MTVRTPLAAASLAFAMLATPAAAQEVFAGVYDHGVDTPFTLKTGEGGADIAAGYRFAPVEALGAIGKPEPYLVASVNTTGDTSFAAVGLSWTIGKGPVYLRPGIGLAIHDGPSRRFNPVTGRETDLGSRVLFEPEIGLGYRINERLSAEAHWMHVSHAQLLNSGQNPGLDMIGLRLNYRLGR